MYNNKYFYKRKYQNSVQIHSKLVTTLDGLDVQSKHSLYAV
jgi:hypothetical protein